MIEALISPSGQFSIQSASFKLLDGAPVINGQRWTGWQVIQAQPVVLACQSPEPNGPFFRLEIEETPPGLTLRFALSDLPAGFGLNSFGIRFEWVENIRAYLRNGYHSWDGSYYVQPGSLPAGFTNRADLETGYALTQLLPQAGKDNLVLGFNRHDRFQQSFTFDTSQTQPSLTILTHWDQKPPAEDGIHSEELVIFENQSVEAGLRQWAEITASHASPAPRVAAQPINGWCSWYNLYAAITEENILDHLRSTQAVTRREQLPMHIFQIDDGFTPEMGDWLEVKPQFPRGMKPILDEIRAAGFTPGLWIAPFLVGNRSKLYASHPDWVVKDRKTGSPLVLMQFYGEFRWHKRSEAYYLLDTTHPQAFAYLRQVFRTWREDWGCEYFKTDFMYYGAHYGPETAVYHQPGLTRVEMWRRVAAMIREEIGSALWMGCGCPLWASVGLVDAVRIGRDVGVRWEGDGSAHSLLRDGMMRNFANGILWQGDPDSVLLREQYHFLSTAEIEGLALYAGMMGGVMTTSDDLVALSDARVKLWKFLLADQVLPCRFPFLGQSDLNYEVLPGSNQRLITRSQDALIVQLRAVKAGYLIHCFNIGDEPLDRQIALEPLGLSAACELWSWEALDWHKLSGSVLQIHLQPHTSVLIRAADVKAC